MALVRAFWISLQFLTCIPVPRFEAGQGDFGKSLLFYPLVGLILGAVLFGVAWLLQGQLLFLQAALLLAVWVAITGALHLDGLADSADAWLGGLGSRERTMQIMKDPCCGPVAVVTLVLILLIKFSALMVLLEQQEWLLLLIVPALARSAAVTLFLVTPYVREDGIASAWVNEIPRLPAWLVIGVLAVVVLLLLSWQGAGLLLVTVVTFLLLRWLMSRRLGGTTGDTAGAMIEILEVTVLLAGVFLLKSIIQA